MAKQRIVYILLALLLGGLGIHNFYAGHTGRAVAQLLITIFVAFTFWLILPLFLLVGTFVFGKTCLSESLEMPDVELISFLALPNSFLSLVNNTLPSNLAGWK